MRNLLIFISLTISIASFGQENNKTKSSREIFFSPGVSYQKQFFGEMNLMLGNHIDERGAGVVGLRVGVESNFNKNNFIIAPKANIEIAFIFGCIRLGTVSYFSKSNIDLRLLPEIGLSYLGIINLTYGYGIPLLKDRVSDISKSRITLTINYNRKMWSDYNFIIN